MPVGLGLKELAILGRMWSQSLLKRGAPSVLLSKGLRVCIAACSVRSSWDLDLVCVSMVVSFNPMACVNEAIDGPGCPPPEVMETDSLLY